MRPDTRSPTTGPLIAFDKVFLICLLGFYWGQLIASRLSVGNLSPSTQHKNEHRVIDNRYKEHPSTHYPGKVVINIGQPATYSDSVTAPLPRKSRRPLMFWPFLN